MAAPRKASAADGAAEDDFPGVITDLLAEMDFLDTRKQWAARRRVVAEKAVDVLDTISLHYHMVPPIYRGVIVVGAGVSIYAFAYGSGTLKA